MLKKKFVPGAILAVALAGSWLPFATTSITGPKAFFSGVGRAHLSSGSVWMYSDGESRSRPGWVLLGVLGVAGVVALSCAVTGLSRLSAAALVLVSAFGTKVGVAVLKGSMASKVFEAGVELARAPGLGLIWVVAAIGAMGVFGLYGLVSPDSRFARQPQ